MKKAAQDSTLSVHAAASPTQDTNAKGSEPTQDRRRTIIIPKGTLISMHVLGVHYNRKSLRLNRFALWSTCVLSLVSLQRDIGKTRTNSTPTDFWGTITRTRLSHSPLARERVLVDGVYIRTA